MLQRRSRGKTALLGQVPLFEHCSKRELEAIARVTDEIDLPEGRNLMREGERGRELFVILDGAADVRRDGQTLTTLGPGDVVGEIALLSKVPRTATVTAVTPVNALVLEDRAFRKLTEDVPGIAQKVARTLAERVVET